MARLAVLLLLAAALLAGLASSAVAGTRGCGDIFQEGVSPQKIRASHVGCKPARKLANRVSRSGEAPFDGCILLDNDGYHLTNPCRKRGYRCTGERMDSRLSIRCRKIGRPARRVSWFVD